MQSKDSKVYSVIDIGTNTCLLLIARLTEKNLTKLFEAQEIPRLGRDLYRTGLISKEAFQSVLEIMREYISISKKYDAEKVFSFGTSAMRDARNSSELIDFINLQTGIEIKILTGEEEAKYGYEGATFDFKKGVQYAVLDIGGGSTEISFRKDQNIVSVSIDIGSVRIYEMFFKGIFNPANIENARIFVIENLCKTDYVINNQLLIGVAGTLTTLSAIKNNLKEFDERVIHKDVLTFDEVNNIFRKLISMSESERLASGSFMKGRSDVIVSGTLILIEIMNYFQIDSVNVSTKGLRYGLLLNIPDFYK
ncbi:MAG: Ppx/GppA family phosphatase [bacterium]